MSTERNGSQTARIQPYIMRLQNATYCVLYLFKVQTCNFR